MQSLSVEQVQVLVVLSQDWPDAQTDCEPGVHRGARAQPEGGGASVFPFSASQICCAHWLTTVTLLVPVVREREGLSCAGEDLDTAKNNAAHRIGQLTTKEYFRINPSTAPHSYRFADEYENPLFACEPEAKIQVANALNTGEKADKRNRTKMHH